MLRANALPAARPRRARPSQPSYAFIDLAPLDSLLVNDGLAAERAAAAEGRAGRLTAARSLVVGGIVAGVLVAGALTGVIVMASAIVRSIAQA